MLPAYAFGYGLSYTTFDIAAPALIKQQYKSGEYIILTTMVKIREVIAERNDSTIFAGCCKLSDTSSA